MPPLCSPRNSSWAHDLASVRRASVKLLSGERQGSIELVWFSCGSLEFHSPVPRVLFPQHRERESEASSIECLAPLVSTSSVQERSFSYDWLIFQPKELLQMLSLVEV